MNENIQHEFFIWEEKSLIDQSQNLLKNEEQDKCVTITETNQNVENLHWKDITDVKLRRKMRQKAYYETNKEEINKRHKNYNQKNEEKVKLQQKLWYQSNINETKLQRKLYRENNKEQIRIQQKSYRDSNKNELKIKSKEYYSKNKEKIKLYDQKNKEKRKLYTRKRDKLKRKTDIQYKLSCNLRSRLYMAIDGNYKSGSAVKDLGCSIEQLKSYLESKFQPGMTWDNWNIDGWHIDHIKPLASFDLTDRNQLLEACHYTNLQPLWAKDNISKRDKII